jgi:hypothetical protein
MPSIMKNKFRNWRPFKEGREYVRSLGLRNLSEWLAWAKSEERPGFIPANPSVIYWRRGWVDIGDWLGIDIVYSHGGNWRSFEEAREFVRSLGLKNYNEWRTWSRSYERPKNIPSSPGVVYEKEGWKGFGDWLGTGRIACQNKVYRSFRKARSYARNLGLKNLDEWKAWAKGPERPEDIPMHADRTYKDHGWKSWGDWLGTGRIVTSSVGHRPFEEAREYARSLGLKTSIAWREWSKSGNRPKDIPSNPEVIYRGKGWISYADWLGTGKAGKGRKK